MTAKNIHLPEGWKARVLDEGLPTAKVLRSPRKSLGDLFSIRNCEEIISTLRKEKINVLLGTMNDDREMEDIADVYWKSLLPRPLDTPTECADMVDVISAIRSEDVRSAIKKVISHLQCDSRTRKYIRRNFTELLRAKYKRKPWGINADRVGELLAHLFIMPRRQPKRVRSQLQEINSRITSFVSLANRIGTIEWKNHSGLLAAFSNRDSVHRRADDIWHTDSDGFEGLLMLYKPLKSPHELYRTMIQKIFTDWECSVEPGEKGATKKF